MLYVEGCFFVFNFHRHTLQEIIMRSTKDGRGPQGTIRMRKTKSRAKPPGSQCRAKHKKSGLTRRKYKGRSKPQLAINICETSSFSDVYGTAPTMSATRTTVTAPWRFRQSFPATFCKELSNATHVPSDTTAKPMAKPSSARPMSAKPDHCKRSPLPNMPRGVCTHSDQLEKKNPSIVTSFLRILPER